MTTRHQFDLVVANEFQIGKHGDDAFEMATFKPELADNESELLFDILHLALHAARTAGDVLKQFRHALFIAFVGHDLQVEPEIAGLFVEIENGTDGAMSVIKHPSTMPASQNMASV